MIPISAPSSEARSLSGISMGQSLDGLEELAAVDFDESDDFDESEPFDESDDYSRAANTAYADDFEVDSDDFEAESPLVDVVSPLVEPEDFFFAPARLSVL